MRLFKLSVKTFFKLKSFKIIKGCENMKRKILVIIICALLITTFASFTATAKKCERKPSTHIITENSPPDIPTVEIPENVIRGRWIHVKTVTTDPDNDNVYYKYDIDGHDYGWVGPFKSGVEHIEKIMVIVPVGTYTLGVQAKDINGAESGWDYSIFNVVKTKSAVSPFLNFLQNYPNLYSLLQNLLGL